MPGDQNNRELFEQIAAGDKQAFTDIFYHYYPRLFPFVLKKVKSGDVAEELIQDMFLKIWINRDTLAGVENPQAYIYRIAANLVLDHFRKLALEHKIFQGMPAIMEAKGDTSTQAGLDLRETQQIISKAVHKLPRKQKMIYSMRQEGLSYDEIAQQLGISINTVKNQLVIAARSIREYLVKHGISSLALVLFYSTL